MCPEPSIIIYTDVVILGANTLYINFCLFKHPKGFLRYTQTIEKCICGLPDTNVQWNLLGDALNKRPPAHFDTYCTQYSMYCTTPPCRIKEVIDTNCHKLTWGEWPSSWWLQYPCRDGGELQNHSHSHHHHQHTACACPAGKCNSTT